VPLNQESPIYSITGDRRSKDCLGDLEATWAARGAQTLMRANLGTRSTEMSFAMAMYMTYKAIVHGMLS
jgi:hypothetical protein